VPIKAEQNPIQAEGHQWGLRSALPAEEHRNGGGWVRSAESHIGATIQTKKHQWEFRSSYPRLRSAEMGV